ncbi:hypothetical protein ACM39_14430 [Chryseobacterium sp. FH2]|uniref:hypothetical protein n=1 Tax=Chryseobacterium sp. FH2 TaxID=1674291 RepID=UPI00065B049C|nr:hypothetical protein [Chryseobacterium sp. FH2]KMQ67342.1 hypothetical protein ACM39_14430 [Chryseobacterium sp. FH2]
MKKIFLASSLILLFSCGENKPDNKPLVENAVDNAESSITSLKDSKLYSRDVNMIHQIYGELIKNDKTLQILNNKVNSIDGKTQEITSQYDNIISKSETYYNNAETLAKSVTDSITRKEIEKEIKFSSEEYNSKIKHIKDLIEEINKNRVKIHDEYIVFKIRKTLPEIEKYQDAHPLKTDSLENFITKQNQLLNELKNVK